MASPGKHHVRLRYAKPGTQPPVYAAGTFTNPPWVPFEMSSTPGEGAAAGQLQFYLDINDVPEGEHHYKFRLGTGDMWVLDEGAETSMFSHSKTCSNVLTDVFQ